MGIGDKIENMKDDLVGKAKEATGKAKDDEGRSPLAGGRPSSSLSALSPGRREVPW